MGTIPTWLTRLFFFDERKLAGDERLFVRTWINDLNERFTKFGMILGAIYLVTGLAFMPITILPELLAFSVTSHSILLLIIVGAGLFHKVTERPISGFAILIHVLSSAALSYFCYSMISLSADPDIRWFSVITLVSVNGWMMLACPSQFRVWKFAAAFYLISGIGSLMITDLSPHAIAVAAIVLCVFLGAKAMLSALIKREALRTFHHQMLAKQAERQKIEHELNLAQKIQDSMLPPSHIKTPDGTSIKVFRSTHSGVGGDWVAHRWLEQGSSILVVADAAGKGMQAALVVHALQSLWARSLSYPTFDPEQWLKEVNSCLLCMGEKETHAATVGVFVIRENDVTYWSAGHPPAWSVGPRNTGRQVEAIMARGNMLGISNELLLQPGYHALDGGGGFLLFGSDGVFSKGTRHQKREILQILDLSLSSDSLPTELCPTEDDRTLVILEKRVVLRLAS